MDTGERIREYRKENGVSLRAFAEKARCSHEFIRQVENGANNVKNPELLKRIYGILDGNAGV